MSREALSCYVRYSNMGVVNLKRVCWSHAISMSGKHDGDTFKLREPPKATTTTSCWKRHEGTQVMTGDNGNNVVDTSNSNGQSAASFLYVRKPFID